MATPRESTILHVDMDAFYASVEQRDHPEWRGKPVVVGSGPNERGVVCTASYEARKFGIRAAMPSREAGKRCPHAIFTPPDMKKYAEASGKIFAIFYRYTPQIETLSLDEAFLDVSHSLGLFGTGLAIAEGIRGAIRNELGLTASVGIAGNKFLAKVGSDLNKPDGVTVVPTDESAIRDFLAPLPVGRLWGVGKVTGAVLEREGITTIKHVQEAPLERLEHLVGSAQAGHFKRLAFGIDSRQVEGGGEAKSISREHTFSEDVRDPQRVRQTLLGLMEHVGRQVREEGKYARVVSIKVRWQGFETITRQTTLAAPSCDDFTLRAAGLELFSNIRLSKPVRLIGFGVTALSESPGDQLTMVGADGKDSGKMERLSRTIDRIKRELEPPGPRDRS